MPLFRVETLAETVQITAARVVQEVPDLVFESPRSDGLWEVRHRVPTGDVTKLTRRVNEVSGAISWVVENPSSVTVR